MIEINPATITDLPIIQQLAFDIWPSAYLKILGREQLDYMLEKFYSLSSLQQQLTVLNHRFILAVENEIPIGFASFSAHKDSSVFHLNKIYVLPNQQGKNIGKKMLDYIISEIINLGAKSLQLNVNRHNKAFRFYEKQGFSIIASEDIDIGSGYFMNDFVMELPLSK